jgi:hypothetical protein
MVEYRRRAGPGQAARIAAAAQSGQKKTPPCGRRVGSVASGSQSTKSLAVSA